MESAESLFQKATGTGAATTDTRAARVTVYNANITDASKVKPNYGNETMSNEQNIGDAEPHPVDTLVKCGCVCIADATKSQQDFWNTYTKQSGYKKYSVETFVKDSLYGIGIALNKSEFDGCDGFDKFKSILKEYLNT